MISTDKVLIVLYGFISKVFEVILKDSTDLINLPLQNDELLSGSNPLCANFDSTSSLLCLTDPNSSCHRVEFIDSSTSYQSQYANLTFSHKFGSMHTAESGVFVFGGEKTNNEELNSLGLITNDDDWKILVDGTEILPLGLAGHSSVFFGTSLGSKF